MIRSWTPLGDRLRKTRTDRDLSLAEVSEALHVRQGHLKALEADDYASLPPGPYARALIRGYATFLGLDAAEMLEEYVRIRPPERESIKPSLPVTPRSRVVSLKAVLTVLVVGICIGIFAYIQAQYTTFKRSLDVEGGVTAPVLATPQAQNVPGLPATFPSPTAIPTATLLPSPTPVVGVEVQLRTVESSWVQIWQDGNQVLADTLPGGIDRTFSASQAVTLRVGNAAAVTVVVNGVAQAPLGTRGEVVEATWSREPR